MKITNKEGMSVLIFHSGYLSDFSHFEIWGRSTVRMDDSRQESALVALERRCQSDLDEGDEGCYVSHGESGRMEMVRKNGFGPCICFYSLHSGSVKNRNQKFFQSCGVLFEYSPAWHNPRRGPRLEQGLSLPSYNAWNPNGGGMKYLISFMYFNLMTSIIRMNFHLLQSQL
jgi:hypothetical protein